MKYIISNEQDMHNLVIELLSKLNNPTIKSNSATILALNGELGAGKTTFTKALAKELGIVEHITSPTFIIQKSYQCPEHQKYSNKSVEKKQNPLIKSHVGKYERITKLVHIDAYRLESGGDAEVLDLRNTALNPANLVIIEWAENIKDILPKSAININFKYIDETTREVSIQD